MYSPNDFIEEFQKMMKDKLVIAPWLTRHNGEDRMSRVLLEEITRAAHAFADKYWYSGLAISFGGDMTVAKERVSEAYYETVSATAINLSHLEIGRFAVGEEMVAVAVRLVDNFVKTQGPEALIGSYLLTILYEDLQAIRHYEGLSIDEFLQGNLHRPWGKHSLARELQILLDFGTIGIDECKQVLYLTDLGNQLLDEVVHVLVESGFLHARSRLMRMNSFNTVENIESMMQVLNPLLPELRKRLVQESDIEPGMRVLELGCGAGAMTFDAGLFQTMGASGSLVALDPAAGMLAVAKQKRESRGADWVELIHGKAEHIPYPNDSFDRVTGFAFLHFTNFDEALREVARVLKPGGLFTTLYPLHFPQRNAFFLEWFEPLLKLQKSGGSKPDTLPGADTIPNLLKRYFDDVHVEGGMLQIHYTNPEMAVRFFVDIGNLFEDQMLLLPWQARIDLVNELIQRGEMIGNKYSPEQLRDEHPSQTIRARARMH